MSVPSDGNSIAAALMDLSDLARQMADDTASIEQGASIIAESLKNGGKVLACGNGGSAADAQHFVAELVGRLQHERPSLPGISLTVDPSIMTAISNDYGFDKVFSRQVEGLGRAGDVLVGISTSGRSPNVIDAFLTAKPRGLKIIALVGEVGSPILDTCDLCLRVPSSNAQRIQELHTAILHALCMRTEQLLSETSG